MPHRPPPPPPPPPPVQEQKTQGGAIRREPQIQGFASQITFRRQDLVRRGWGYVGYPGWGEVESEGVEGKEGLRMESTLCREEKL